MSQITIKALGLRPAATACLEANGIRAVEQLTATELLDHGVVPADLYEIVCQLNDAASDTRQAHPPRR
ncbi:MAG TPA: hypothetical protein VH061_16275 [Solirubrobacteraceae bacterium]|jgi:hypothetical protein|nr:hypothetical protein [Solirubrobacteraceae bacterium]